jgi:Fructose-bisphosphate aldolase class-I
MSQSVDTLTRRFDAFGIQSTEQSRRAYREMLFTTSGAAEFISGAILYDETNRQKGSGGTPLAEVLLSQGIVPGIKVDRGAEPLAGSHRGAGRSARPPLGVSWHGRPLREVAGRDPHHGNVAGSGVRERECARPRPIRRTDHARSRSLAEERALPPVCLKQSAMGPPVSALMREREAVPTLERGVPIGIEALMDQNLTSVNPNRAKDVGLRTDLRHTKELVELVEPEAKLEVLLHDVLDRHGRLNDKPAIVREFGEQSIGGSLDVFFSPI